MKFLAIDIFAAKELILNRKLQSAEYAEAAKLISFIKNGENFEIKGSLRGEKSQSGYFLTTTKIEKNKLLIFDKENFHGFEKKDHEIISIIQKVCRLAIKLWENIGFSPCEKIIQGTSYIAVLPFSFTTGKSYKVIVDRSPDSKRQQSRGCNHFLVFHDGVDKNHEIPPMAAFRAAEKEVRGIEPYLFEENKVTKGSSYVAVSETFTSNAKNSPFMGMNYWTENLTTPQKKFVFSDRLGPDILKGAAGTGKTLCLVLRCIHQLIEHKKNGSLLKSVFFTHSIATKKSIENIVSANNGDEFLSEGNPQSLKITTLQEWCIENLQGRISATEYLDKDALESKNTQLLYINESVEEYLTTEFNSGKKFISEEFKEFFEKNDPWTLSIYIQNEISIYIKGRANEDFDAYKKLLRSNNSIPLITEEDFSTIFYIFKLYQEKLVSLGLFDSDDITISSLLEVTTPIWRRRKIREGYDVLYIDETHLFNLNELSLFHNLLKNDSANIVFTIDRAQAPTDNAISSSDVINVMGMKGNYSENLETSFRSSSDIVNLASCVLASGATLFSHLENPLVHTSPGFTSDEDKLCETPYLIDVNGTEQIIETAIAQVDYLCKKLQTPKSNILIVSCDDSLLERFKSYSLSNNLTMQFIEKRGDYEAVGNAQRSNSYIIGGIDYVGGLEFQAVIVVGADRDKFPKKSSLSGESNHFVRYSSFNQLYVAITRAKYVVAFIIDKSKGYSDVLSTAITENLISTKLTDI